jgi:hypothetical protein
VLRLGRLSPSQQLTARRERQETSSQRTAPPPKSTITCGHGTYSQPAPNSKHHVNQNTTSSPRIRNYQVFSQRRTLCSAHGWLQNPRLQRRLCIGFRSSLGDRKLFVQDDRHSGCPTSIARTRIETASGTINGLHHRDTLKARGQDGAIYHPPCRHQRLSRPCRRRTVGDRLGAGLESRSDSTGTGGREDGNPATPSFLLDPTQHPDSGQLYHLTLRSHQATFLEVFASSVSENTIYHEGIILIHMAVSDQCLANRCRVS